eukprot:1064371-Rhodomonas_salina.1
MLVARSRCRTSQEQRATAAIKPRERKRKIETSIARSKPDTRVELNRTLVSWSSLLAARHSSALSPRMARSVFIQDLAQPSCDIPAGSELVSTVR